MIHHLINRHIRWTSFDLQSMRTFFEIWHFANVTVICWQTTHTHHRMSFHQPEIVYYCTPSIMLSLMRFGEPKSVISIMRRSNDADSTFFLFLCVSTIAKIFLGGFSHFAGCWLAHFAKQFTDMRKSLSKMWTTRICHVHAKRIRMSYQTPKTDSYIPQCN
jgi:hypothetical protein